jgi:hypothetical protein
MRNPGFLVTLMIVFLTSYVQGQSTYPPLEVSMDDENLSITNPSEHTYDVELLFFFWDGTKDKQTIKAKDVTIVANDVTMISLQRLGKGFTVERDEPLPETIAFSLRDDEKAYSVCYYSRTDDRRYIMQDDKTEFLTEEIRKIPGYRDADTR